MTLPPSAVPRPRSAPSGYSRKMILVPSAVLLVLALILLFLPAAFGWPPNNPYRDSVAAQNIMFSTFTDPPKTLDPAISYYVDEAGYLGSIMETPFQYDYLKRPSTLIPDAVDKIPQPVYLDKDGKVLPEDAPDSAIARVEYTFEVRKGMFYQPHPCFAKGPDGKFLYHDLAKDGISISGISDINDPFFKTGTREVTAEDFVNQIRRMGDPRLIRPCPLVDRWCEIIDGYKEYVAAAQEAYDKEVERQKTLSNGIVVKSPYHRVLIPLDLSKIPLSGVETVDRYHFRLYLKRRYPQMLYWMALFFFSPVPHEAEQFYYQEQCVDNGLAFKKFPVGCGPYYISKYDPAEEIRLSRNPNYYQWEKYPSDGSEDDRKAGLVDDAGKLLPFLDGIRYMHEHEGLPAWNKFVQGYYDSSGITAEAFDKAIKVDTSGYKLTPEFVNHGISLVRSQDLATYYMCFNMRDPLVGNVDAKTEPDAQKRAAINERHRKLRVAISMVMDWKEYIQIFNNGRGIVANGILPPGIFGFHEGKEGIDPYTQVWDAADHEARSQPLADAQKLLAEAGYPNGIDAKTGNQLALTFDNDYTTAHEMQYFVWYQKQFAKLGIQLQSATTDEAKYDEKIHKGDCQIYGLGWYADYPDPENFLFLLTAKECVVDTGGENIANYTNPEYDKLFDEMKAMPNGPKRQELIDRMVDMVRHDAPWAFSFHPQGFGLVHGWLHNLKPMPVGSNGTKYLRIDAAERVKDQLAWNQPQYGWPLLMLAVVFVPIFAYGFLKSGN
ncbi:MAG: ABC transporter substrate-binding protein [Planctomycetota bacterium]